MSVRSIPVTIAVEGYTDTPIVQRILEHAGFQTGAVYEVRGKDQIDIRLPGYNNAARFAPWLVLRDLDQDAPCAPDLARTLLPAPSRHMCFRIAVHKVESWLLADSERLALFLGVSAARIPQNPDQVADPKAALVKLARRSTSRAIRQDMVPRPNSGASVGPGYSGRIREFAAVKWRPRVAATRSASLARCLHALRRWA